MISEAVYWGGARYGGTTPASTLIHPRLARCWSFNPGADSNLDMPDARTILAPGGPILFVWNISATRTITARTNTGVTIGTIPPGNIGALWLLANTTQAGSWVIRSLPRLGSTLAITMRKLLVAGGTGALTSVDTYTPGTDTWASTTPLSKNKLEGASGAIGRRRLFIGYYPSTATISEVLEERDESGTWTVRASSPAGVARTQGASAADAFFVFSGDASTAVYRYTGNAWTTRGVFPIAKPRSSAQGVGRRAYIMSGGPVPSPSLAYNADTDTYWSLPSSPGPGRHSVASFAVREKVFVAGGYSDTGPVRYSSVESFDVTTNTWATETALSLGARYGGAGVGADGRGYYIAGRNNADAQVNGAVYYLGATWVTIANAATSRSEVCNLAQGF